MLTPGQRRWIPDAGAEETNSTYIMYSRFSKWSRVHLWWRNPHCALERSFLLSRSHTMRRFIMRSMVLHKGNLTLMGLSLLARKRSFLVLELVKPLLPSGKPVPNSPPAVGRWRCIRLWIRSSGPSDAFQSYQKFVHVEWRVVIFGYARSLDGSFRAVLCGSRTRIVIAWATDWWEIWSDGVGNVVLRCKKGATSRNSRNGDLIAFSSHAP